MIVRRGAIPPTGERILSVSRQNRRVQPCSGVCKTVFECQRRILACAQRVIQVSRARSGVRVSVRRQSWRVRPCVVVFEIRGNDVPGAGLQVDAMVLG